MVGRKRGVSTNMGMALSRLILLLLLAATAGSGRCLGQTTTNLPPTVRAIWPEAVFEGEAVRLSADVFEPDPQLPYTYLWRLPDGSYSIDPSPELRIDRPGIASIELWVTNALGLGAFPASKDIVVSNLPPTLLSLAPAACLEGERIHLQPQFGRQTDSSRYRYEWMLPDGSSSALPAPAWTFAEPGRYSVSLVVRELGLEWVYNNSRYTGPRANYLCDTNEIGDEVRLAGTNRVVSQFEFVCYGNLTNLATIEKEQARGRLRIYASDGPKLPHRNIRTPGTLLYESDPFTLEEGLHWKTFRGLNLTVPDIIVWTFLTEGVPQTHGKQAGVVFYNSSVPSDADVGSSYDDYWRKSDDGAWLRMNCRGKPVANFGARILSNGGVVGQSEVVTQVIEVRNAPPMLVAANVPITGLVGTELLLSASASDPGGGDVTCEWHFGDQTSAQGQEVRHTYNASGAYAIDLLVRDTAGGQAQTNLTVVISADPKALRFSSAPMTRVNENQPYAYQVQTITPGAGQTLRITSRLLPPWLALTDRGDGTAMLEGQPTQAQVGAHIVELSLSDGVSTINQSFTIEVVNLNDPPTVSPIPNQTIAAGRELGPLPFTVADPDNAAGDLRLRFTSSAPEVIPSAAIRLQGEGGQRQIWITPAGTPGAATITLEVSDGALTAATSFVVTVRSPAAHTLTLPQVVGGTISVDSPLPEYEDGTLVTLTAAPLEGFTFAGWSGDASGVANPLSLSMDGNKTIAAVFRDTGLPVLRITSEPGPRVSENFDLIGTVEDNVGVASVEWDRDDAPQGQLSLSAGTFRVPGLRLTRGEHRFRVIARDAAGNQAVAEVVASWAPGIVLALVSPPPQREGRTIKVPLKLTSRGEVNGMDFTLTYDTPYLGEPVFKWSSVASLGAHEVDVATPGRVTGVFATTPGQTIPAGVQEVGSLELRVRSLPYSMASGVLIEVAGLEATDVNGRPITLGLSSQPASPRLVRRQFVADINGNDRWDVNDAGLLMQLVLKGYDPARSWDLGLNDVNGNNRLDSGDVARVLRVIAGLDSEPVVLPQSIEDASEPALQSASSQDRPGAGLHGVPEARAVLVVPTTTLRAGEPLTVQVRLEDVTEPITGVSFLLRYPANALRLASSTPYRLGELVPAGSQNVWNVMPDEGIVRFASTATNVWPASTGQLAELRFEVLSSVPDEAQFSISLLDLELAKAGYGVAQLASPPASLESGLQYSPSRIEAFSRSAAGRVDFRVTADSSQRLLLERSSDLIFWRPCLTLPDGGGAISVTDDALAGATPEAQAAQFFRVRGQAPPGSVLPPVPVEGPR